jgi:hypothetical protein
MALAIGVCWAVVLEVKGKIGSKLRRFYYPVAGLLDCFEHRYFWNANNRVPSEDVHFTYKCCTETEGEPEIYDTGHVAGSCRTARRYRSSDNESCDHHLFRPFTDNTSHLGRSIFHASWSGFS